MAWTEMDVGRGCYLPKRVDCGDIIKGLPDLVWVKFGHFSIKS
jgi:hypothetical protein